MRLKRLVKFIKGYFNGAEVISRDIMEQMNYDEECKDNHIEWLEVQVDSLAKALEHYKKALEHTNTNHESFYEIPKEFMSTDKEVKGYVCR